MTDRSLPDRSRIFLIAIWFGLAAGLMEGITSTLLRGVPGFAIRVPPDILWIAPIFYLFLFLLIGAFFRLFFHLRGKEGGTGVVIGLFTWVSLFSWLMVFDKLHIAAALLLSLGIAVQTGRWLNNHRQAFSAFVTRGLVVIGAIAVILGAMGAGWNRWQEHQEVLRLPEARLGMANVILIVMDTVRADHLSSYGYGRPTTPHIDRLAREGVRFEYAFANSSWTLPSHASLFTGRLPHEHGADWLIPLGRRYPTLAQILAGRGYRTSAFSANTSYVTPEWGLAAGFSHFEAYGSSLADDIVRTQYGRRLALNILPRVGYYDIPGRKRASRVNEEFLSWLDGRQGRPFFVFLNYMEVHDPYLTIPSFQRKFSNRPARGDLINFQFQPKAFRQKAELSREEVQMEIDGYDGCLAYLDASLGELFSELAKRNLDRNTLLILTSDHGESFGNHDLFGHGNSLYLETLHVPLIFSWPGRIPLNKKVSQIVGLHRVLATVAELLDVPFPPSRGKSLAGLWSGSTPPQESDGVVLSEVNRVQGGPPNYPTTGGDLKSLLNDHWHFILSANGRAELYAWRKDPQERENLAETPRGAVAIQGLKKELGRLSR